MAIEIHEYLELDPEARTISCLECGEQLCDADQNYKKHSAMRTGPVTDIGPVFTDPEEIYEEAPDVEFRQFFCPNCATLLDYEVVPEDEPILHDLDIDVDKISG
ncbi:MAG: acetone carboxylase subunit gamma [Haloarculaceae archaeon]